MSNDKLNDKLNYIISRDGDIYTYIESAFEGCFTDNCPDHIDISGMKKFGLTKDETLHILAYTGHSARWINSKLIDNSYKECCSCQTYIKNLDKALNKIEQTKESTVYHVTRFNPFIEMDYFITNSYISTSPIPCESLGDVHWIITPLKDKSSAKDCRTITNFKDEIEVLLMRGTKLRKEKIEMFNNITCVYLKEVP